MSFQHGGFAYELAKERDMLVSTAPKDELFSGDISGWSEHLKRYVDNVPEPEPKTRTPRATEDDRQGSLF